MGGESGELAFKLENSAVNERFFEKKGGVVGGEAGWEIIGPVEDEVVRLQKFEGVFGGEPSVVADEIEVGINGKESAAGGIEFEFADLVGIMDGLAVEIGKFDTVVVDHGDGANAGGGKVGGCG